MVHGMILWVIFVLDMTQWNFFYTIFGIRSLWGIQALAVEIQMSLEFPKGSFFFITVLILFSFEDLRNPDEYVLTK